jgi:hypothetical protein
MPSLHSCGGPQIGRDPRISGPVLAASLAAGLTGKGVHVARFGIATTPAMFMSTITQGEGSCRLNPFLGNRTYLVFFRLACEHARITPVL